jgi:hypothetical protein
MILELENLKQYGIPIDNLKYRGFDIDFYEDVSGHQLIAIWNDKIYEFGVYNTQAKEDMKLIIDDHLDTITRFENNPFWYGARLEYFDNGGHRDIRLIYRDRILRVYLTQIESNDQTQDLNTSATEYILRDSSSLLFKFVKERENEKF